MYVLGIDPGKSGGVAVFKNLQLLEIFPFQKDNLDNVLLLKHKIWKTYNPLSYVFIEEGHAFPGQGVSSTFSFGFFHGMIYGVFATDVAIKYIKTKDWQKFFSISLPRQSTKGLSQKEKNRIKAMRRKKIKEKTIQTAKELFPVFANTIANKDGLADAILIGRYGILTFGGEPLHHDD